jgi:glutamate synthase (NADPH/NADH) small chain
MLGHDVTVFNRDSKPGGLNEYGIAAYKTIDDFAQREVDYILSIGGIDIKNDTALGSNLTLAELRDKFDAVFLGIGLGSVNELGLENEGLSGVESAIDYIAELRQADDKSSLPVGRDVVVIGGGMTAIDIAVQSKRLGAEQVVIAYRRGPEQMGASEFEQQLAQTNGVAIHHWVKPVGLHGDGSVSAIELEKTALGSDGKLVSTGETYVLDADVVFKAIGQTLVDDDLDTLRLQSGRIVVDESQATSMDNVWAGGDCVVGGDDLTVSAVQHGKVAAIAIDRSLRNG